MKFILSACILVFAANLLAKENSGLESAVVLKGDQISDAQVFSTFLELVTNEGASTAVAIGLGFDIEDDRELRNFHKFQKKMELVDVKLKKSLRKAWFETHCTDGKGAFAKSREKILREMDTVDDLRMVVTKNHLDSAVKSLGQEDRSLVLNHLRYMKESTTVIVSSAEAFEEGSYTAGEQQ